MAWQLDPSPVAIIGAACLYPQAAGTDAYWRLITEGRPAFGPLPEGRWDWSRYRAVLRGPRGACTRAACLDEQEFGWRKYRMPPVELGLVHRMEARLVEVIESALVDANHLRRPADRGRVALFVGSMGLGLSSSRVFTLRTRLAQVLAAIEQNCQELAPDARAGLQGDFQKRFEEQLQLPDFVSWVAPGISLGRVCNLLDINGPHVAVDAGEASSLAALELGVRQLQQKEQDLAIVGGLGTAVHPLLLAALTRLGWLGMDTLRPFDRDGQGSLLGEGAGAVILKRLGDALRDGDRIDAVIRGVGSASQGRRRVPTSPCVEALEEAIQHAHEQAGFSPATVDFVETHGCGLAEWDAVEAQALGAAFMGRDGPLRLGSAKALVGNQLGGAGLAGLIKLVLQLKHGELPAELVPASPVEGVGPGTSLEFGGPPAPWTEPGTGRPRRGGVSALSLSGACHYAAIEGFSRAYHADVAASARAPSEQRGMRIAVVGVGSVLPGARDVESYWQNLIERKEALVEIPAERFPLAPVHRRFEDWEAVTAAGGTAIIYLRRGGFVTEFQADPARWMLPPRALRGVDRTQLWALDSVRQAVGMMNRPPPPGSRTAVVFGHSPQAGSEILSEFRVLHAEFRVPLEEALEAAGVAAPRREQILERVEADATADLPEIDEDSLPGYQGSSLTARVGFAHDWRGLNLAVDSLCASSFAAVEVACRALLHHECDAAVAGGVWANLTTQYYNTFCLLRVLAPHEQDPFGPDARGFIPGEGAGAVVLKREEDARRDGDRILALIQGVAGSSDGRGKWLFSINPSGLARAVRRALEVSDVDPDTVPLVEAHALSVPAGDIGEMNTYARFYGRAGRVAVSGLKGNIGHLNAASGVAALIKAVLSLDRGVVVPVARFSSLHPEIELNGAELEVQTQVTRWPEGKARRAAVTCYGMGGTCYHLLLDAPSPTTRDGHGA